MASRRLTPRQRLVTLALVLLGNFAPVVVAVLDHLGEHPTVFYYGAAAATLAPLAAFVASGPRWHRLQALLHFVGIPGLVAMQAYTGGPASPYAVLMVMPAIWYGSSVTGVERRIGVVLMVASSWLPSLLLGAPAYPLAVGPGLVLNLVLLGVVGSLAYFSAEVGRLHTQLRQDATQDRLTGLLNRRGWEEACATAMSTAELAPVCVALFDLDGLKQVNDTLGHDQGDRLLHDTGRRLHQAFGTEAALARLGGDEFALLVVGSPVVEVHDRLELLREATPERGAYSAGLAELAPGEALGDAMRRADLALYEVKSTGRGRAALADDPVRVEDSLHRH